MKKYKALQAGFDNVKVREAGEVFPFGGKKGSWMEEVSDDEFRTVAKANADAEVEEETIVPKDVPGDLHGHIRPSKETKKAEAEQGKDATDEPKGLVAKAAHALGLDHKAGDEKLADESADQTSKHAKELESDARDLGNKVKAEEPEKRPHGKAHKGEK